jgi:hypothetical protein
MVTRLARVVVWCVAQWLLVTPFAAADESAADAWSSTATQEDRQNRLQVTDVERARQGRAAVFVACSFLPGSVPQWVRDPRAQIRWFDRNHVLLIVTEHAAIPGTGRTEQEYLRLPLFIPLRIPENAAYLTVELPREKLKSPWRRINFDP